MNDELSSEDSRSFPALKLMERTAPPVRAGEWPVWRSQPPAAVDHVHVPGWNWYGIRDFLPGARVATLTTNAPTLDALGLAQLPHAELRHVGPLAGHPNADSISPGYYLIVVPYWPFSGTIVSPLGDSARLETDGAVWVAAPTLQLCLRLAADGSLGQVTILDSYVCRTATTFGTWSHKLRSAREACMDLLDIAHRDGLRPEGCSCTACRRYRSLGHGITEALAVMAQGKSATYRPDWNHTIYAYQAAAAWTRAWMWTFTGMPLVSLGHVDEMRILEEDLSAGMKRNPPPFRYDETGRIPGSLKIKRVGHLDDTPQGVALEKASDMTVEVAR